MVTVFADSTDPRSSKGVIVCLITGKQWNQFDALGTDAKRKEVVLNELAVHLGEKAKLPLSVHMKNWPADPYVQGSYASYWAPEAWTRFGSSLVKPVGRIHWAGTETAVKWPGYFDGAITAGKRAATEVMNPCATK